MLEAPEMAETPLQNQARMLAAQAASLSEDGRIPCDHPGCTARVHPKGLGIHKAKAHGVKGAAGTHPREAAAWPDLGERKKCPHCRVRPLITGMNAHIARAHPERLSVVAAPTPPPRIDAPWRCAQCNTDAHARSLKDPALCIRCVVAHADLASFEGSTNGVS
jgi:hypothetical protein